MNIAETNRLIPERVISAKELFRLVDRPQTVISPTYRVPVRWGSIAAPGNIQTSNESRGVGLLSSADLSMAQPRLFDSAQEVLEETIATLGYKSINKLEGLDIARYQFGLLAYIFLCQAKVDGKNIPFVTYLARGPYERRVEDFGDESLSRFAEHDFNSLKFIANLYQERLAPKVRERFDIVRPIANGTMDYRGDHYTLFTMPFLPYGELNVQQVVFSNHAQHSNLKPTFFYRYAVPWNAEMQVVNDRQGRNAVIRAGQVTNRRVIKSNELDSYNNQVRDILLADMLFHVVTDGFFPSAHFINAGDHVATISDKGFRMRWTSIRGRLANMSVDNFLFKLQSQIEYLQNPQLGNRERQTVFSENSKEKLQALYREAKQLVVSG